MSQDNVVIVNGARTAMGGFQGALAPLKATGLGAASIREAVARAGLQPEDIEDVIMGCVLPAGLGQGPARQAMRQAGLPDSTGATTVNKLCGSGMRATMFGHDMIRAGSHDIVVSGGMESMSNAPYLLEKARAGYRMGHGQVFDHMFLDGLEDAETGRLMGSFAQDVADQRGITREQMDAFAIESLRRAQAAIANGWFADEIVPVTVQTRKGETVVDTDEQPGNANIDKIPNLKPAFKKDGTVTAANASGINDGAAGVLLMSADEAEKRGIEPLARIASYATVGLDPSIMGAGPIYASRKALEKAGWSIDDLDLVEANEAFAAQALAVNKELGWDPAIVNVNGGAIAIGHPIGASGARILNTLLFEMKRRDAKKGLATLCIGSGMGAATIIERV
jgi:acetyl-CoA C-acetyltransferase